MQTAILHHDYDTMIFEQNCSLKRKNRDSAINLANGCKSWTTGVYVKDSSLKGFFSGDNYGDKIMKVMGKDGRTKHVNNRQATQYVATIEAFEDRHWESILETVREFLNEGGKKRKRSKSMSSRASSEFEEAEPENNYILISDED